MERPARRILVEAALQRLAPKIPPHERGVILDHALDSSGLAAAAAETAAWLSMTAYIRHALTDYDALLEEGYDHESARHFVRADMEEILSCWGVRRPLTSEE